MNSSIPPKVSHWSWRSKTLRGYVYQLLAVSFIVMIVWMLAHNTLVNMRNRGIQSGFDFLFSTAGFDIGEHLIPYNSDQEYWRAFVIGVLNTLRVAVLGIILTTIMGVLLGVGRFSRNALVRGICMSYVEVFRNIPVLLQLLMWYLMLTQYLPDNLDPLHVGSFFVSKGGVNFPMPVWSSGYLWMLGGLIAGAFLGWGYRRWAIAKFEQTGVQRSMFWVPLLVLLLATAVGWLMGGAPAEMNFPVKGQFAIEHGGAITPEFLALWLGLTFYTASYVAEVVRAGIQSVPTGQREAAEALGVGRGTVMRLIVLPQAMRVIIPPLTNQYLNLTKNSSLAVAIGYPDIVSISNTTLNQTGRAVECIAIVMLIYLSFSLTTSIAMGWYNKRAAIHER
ncbi:MAG: ABC transporter permease subunit [Burkholderiaceae bacterium]